MSVGDPGSLGTNVNVRHMASASYWNEFEDDCAMVSIEL